MCVEGIQSSFNIVKIIEGVEAKSGIILKRFLGLIFD